MFSETASPSDLSDTPRPFPVARRGLPLSWLNLRVVFMLLIALVSALPAAYVFTRAVEASSNIVYWDEFDTALAMVLRLEENGTPQSFFRELFAMNNEHRMVTSRLLFATLYALTGTVNFSIISMIGNATLVALIVLLVVTAGTTIRRLRLGAFLGLLMFQLQHYENFLWSGSSIDHFQVVLLAAAAMVGVAYGTRRGTIVGGVFATLATFTLAHGILTWLTGGLLLLQQRRWRALAGWSGLGAVIIVAFLQGFATNNSHQFAGTTVDGVLNIAGYWLSLLGAVPALTSTGSAPAFGVILLVLLGWLLAHDAGRREPIAVALTLFAVLALGLISVGRAAESNGVVHSRYMVLGATAWALTGFMLLERYSASHRPLVSLGWTVLALGGFNFTANHLFARQADSWVECRDRAALRYKQHGVDGRGQFTLHPVPSHSTTLLHAAEARGVYTMGSVCEPRSFPKAKPSSRIVYYIEEMTVTDRSAFVGGWAAIPGQKSERGQIHLVLRSEQHTFFYTTVGMSRLDVVAALKDPLTERSGFTFAVDRSELPSENYQIGLLFAEDGQSEYIMTAHRLDLVGAGKALLATGD